MSEIAFRWSGVSLVLGAALLGTAIVTISFKPVMNQPLSPGSSFLLLLASILLLLSLPALYARQVRQVGWVSWVTDCFKPGSFC